MRPFFLPKLFPQRKPTGQSLICTCFALAHCTHPRTRLDRNSPACIATSSHTPHLITSPFDPNISALSFQYRESAEAYVRAYSSLERAWTSGVSRIQAVGFFAATFNDDGRRGRVRGLPSGDSSGALYNLLSGSMSVARSTPIDYVFLE